MTVQILYLTNGEYIISDVEEVEGDPDCLLINPKVIVEKLVFKDQVESIQFKGMHYRDENEQLMTYLTLENFVEYTYQKRILIRSTDILTIVEPREDVLKFYREVIG